MRARYLAMCLPALAVACGDGSSTNDPGTVPGDASAADAAMADAAAGDGSAAADSQTPDGPGPDGSELPDGSEKADGSDASDASEPVCEPFGYFPAPESTFTLPAASNGSYYYTDIQKSFPEVDWTKLDRLYIPAGQYKSIRLSNLPDREATRPLVITNLGGQVQVGPTAPGGNFLWVMDGGANWVLTGRYDPEAKTGDAAFPGHRCGAYADSRGKYGFLSDDAFAKGTYLHMGLAVSAATSFEVEFLEVTRSGFAGMRFLNSRKEGEPAQPMANVRVHDNYIHDVDSEGVYFGWTGAPPSNLMPGLQVYNNRIVRTGSEALQVQDLGEGSRIHHNVFAFGALRWLDNFGAYQDGLSQVHTREGNIELDHNVFVGGAGLLLSFFSAPQTGDGERHVLLHDNYFADTRNLGGYLNGTMAAPSSLTFKGNVFRGLEFSYTTVDPTAKDPGVIFGINPKVQGPVLFDANRWDTERSLVSGIALNGAQGVVTAKDNTKGSVEPVAFVASGYPDVPTQRLSAWGPVATLAPGDPPIQYAVGDLVMHDAQLYRATQPSTGLVPPEHPEAWEKLPLPKDDLRVKASSPHAAMGVR